jgi:hypothetical protein
MISPIDPIFPKLTDQDEWNSLNQLKRSDIVGYPSSADQNYSARVLRYKYPQCERVHLTADTFQVVQKFINAGPVQLTLMQQARQQLLRRLASRQPKVSKEIWLQSLRANGLLPASVPHS